MQGMLLKKTKNVKNMVDKVVGKKVEFKAVEVASLVSELPEEGIPDMKIPSYLEIWQTHYWLQDPMMQFQPFSVGRRPANASEWAKCIWHLDLFIYRVPILKLLGLIALAGWIL